MAEIVGLENISDEELEWEIQNGARFVMFSYCISIVLLTFKQPTSIYFVRSGESAFVKGLPFTFLSLLLGWWGIPFGIIYTIWCVASNCSGGTDVTQEIVAAMAPRHRSSDEYDIRRDEYRD